MIKPKTLTIGERIRFFRKRAELSQLDLELEANLAIGSLTKLEANIHEAGHDVMKRIIVALRLNRKESAYLFGINMYRCKKDEKQILSVPRV